MVSAWSLSYGGVAEALVKMSLGNALGVNVKFTEDDLFSLGYGSVVFEATDNLEEAVLLGEVTASGICINGTCVPLEKLKGSISSSIRPGWRCPFRPGMTKL